jgi:hypothetical protein
MADLTDNEWEAFKKDQYQFYVNEATSAYRTYFWYNIVLSVVVIAASTTTSVFVSNTEINKYIHPVVIAIVSWIATATTLVISSFAIKENKEKNEKLRDNLIAESAFLIALTGPYAVSAEPRKLFVARTTQLYLGTNPATPPTATGT